MKTLWSGDHTLLSKLIRHTILKSSQSIVTTTPYRAIGQKALRPCRIGIEKLLYRPAWRSTFRSAIHNLLHGPGRTSYDISSRGWQSRRFRIRLAAKVSEVLFLIGDIKSPRESHCCSLPLYSPWRTTLQLLHTVLSPSYTGVVILLGSTWALRGGCFAECPLLVTLTPGLCPTWTEHTLVTSAC